MAQFAGDEAPAAVFRRRTPITVLRGLKQGGFWPGMTLTSCVIHWRRQKDRSGSRVWSSSEMVARWCLVRRGLPNRQSRGQNERSWTGLGSGHKRMRARAQGQHESGQGRRAAVQCRGGFATAERQRPNTGDRRSNLDCGLRSTTASAKGLGH